jgi:hypothetical protein
MKLTLKDSKHNDTLNVNDIEHTAFLLSRTAPDCQKNSGGE